MSYLWRRMTYHKPENYKPYRRFILLNTLIWSLPEFAAAFIISRFCSFSSAQTITFVGIVTGYIGVCVGFFGGMIYLMRNSDSSPAPNGGMKQ